MSSKVSSGIGGFLDKLLEKIGEIFIVSLAGITTLLFFDFFYGLLYSFFVSFFKSESEFYIFSFVRWLFEKITSNSSKISPEFLLVLIYAVIWSWGKALYVISTFLHDRLKGNYVKIESEEIHHKRFLKLRQKVIETIKSKNLKVLEETEYTDYILYYLLRELIPKEKVEKLKNVTARALEFGFIGLSLSVSQLLVGLFYSVMAFEHSHCLGAFIFVAVGFNFVLFLILTLEVLRERYISRNFQLYLLFLIDNFLSRSKDEEKNEQAV